MATLKLTLSHYRGDSHVHLMKMNVYLLEDQPEVHQEPRDEVGSLSPDACPARFQRSDLD